MTEYNRPSPENRGDPGVEQRGFLTDAALAVLAGGAGGAANGVVPYVADKLTGSGQDDAPQPQVELPPGVERE
jgi:hypothetical protein